MKTETKIFNPVFENDVDAFIPEIWAAEGLRVLYKNVVAAALVHRDFDDEIAMHGDVVNTRRPAKFTTVRKTDADPVTTQNATATNVAVTLNQHHHVSFIIKDGEESKSMQSLVERYLEPAFEAIAQSIEEVVIGERYNFLGTKAGGLGVDPTIASINNLGTAMTQNLCPIPGRNFIVTPSTHGRLSSLDTFHEADKVGDDGTALREASIGRKLAFNFYQSHNNPTIGSTTIVQGAINDAGGEPVGETSLTVDGFSAAITAGSWITVDGDNTPQLVTGTTGGATPTAIAISPGLSTAVVNNAVVTVYTPAAVDESSGYAAGWVKTITIDGAAIAPLTGQMISDGATTLAATNKYGAMSTPTTTSVLLNRGLDESLANNDILGLGPAGDYNWAFHRDAVTLVTRPLAAPRRGTGALSAVIPYKNIVIRVVITYDGTAQGHRVTADLLVGVKTLDTNLGGILLA